MHIQMYNNISSAFYIILNSLHFTNFITHINGLRCELKGCDDYLRVVDLAGVAAKRMDADVSTSGGLLLYQAYSRQHVTVGSVLTAKAKSPPIPLSPTSPRFTSQPIWVKETRSDYPFWVINNTGSGSFAHRRTMPMTKWRGRPSYVDNDVDLAQL